MHEKETLEENISIFERRRLDDLYRIVNGELGNKDRNLEDRKGTPFEGLEVPRILIPCLSLDCSYPLDTNMTAPANHGKIVYDIKEPYTIILYCTSCYRRKIKKPHITRIKSTENPKSQKMITIKDYIRYHSKFIFANKKGLTSEMFYAYYGMKESKFLKEYQPAPLEL